MKKVVVVNPKGGCGKTTLATNIACYFANCGHRTALMDFDSQGSSSHWLKQRGGFEPSIHGIVAYERSNRVTKAWLHRLPPNTDRVVVDTPAAMDAQQLADHARGADAILIPVLPSEIDIHAASRVVADLLLVAKIERREERVGVVANRTRRNTRMYQKLMRFLDSLDIPYVATLRDSQNYTRASEMGMGIHDFRSWRVREDLRQWEALTHWLDTRPERILSRRVIA